MATRRWDFESVSVEARKYSKVVEFKYGSRGAYDWAERNGVVADVTAFMSEVTDGDKLMKKIEQELGTAARHAKVARDMWDTDPSPFFEPVTTLSRSARAPTWTLRRRCMTKALRSAATGHWTTSRR